MEEVRRLLKTGRFWVASFMGSLFLALVNLIGASAYDFSTVDIYDLSSNGLRTNLPYFIKGFLLILSIAVLGGILVRLISHNEKRETETKRLSFIGLLISILIFLVYLPAYLAYYPGVLAYDSYLQVPMALGTIKLNSFHPVIHTLFLRMCFYLGERSGSTENGLVVYSLIQLLIVSLGLGYLLNCMRKRCRTALPVVVATIYYGIFPTLILFSFIPVKDVFFSITFNIFVLKVYLTFDREEEWEGKDIAGSVLFGLLAVMLRNNCVYAFLGVFILVLLIKRFRNPVFLSELLTIIILYFLISLLISRAFGITHNAPQEKLPVAINQLAAAYVQCDLSEEERQAILAYIPDAEGYNPIFADPIKTNFNVELYNSDSTSFYKLWARTCIKHPKTAIKSFLYLNLHYWYYGADYPDVYADIQYIELDTGEISGVSITKAGMFPSIRDFLDRYAAFETGVQNSRFFKWIFETQLPFWVMMFIFVFAWQNKKGNITIYVGFFFMLWLTHILGPVSNIRYLVAFYHMIPIAIIGLVSEKGNSENN